MWIINTLLSYSKMRYKKNLNGPTFQSVIVSILEEMINNF